jgi:hypothetical protein
MLTLAVRGDLEKWADNIKFHLLTGLRTASEEEGRVALEIQRDAIRDAGLGDRVANAQRLKVSPSGSRLAWEPAVYLYSRAAHIIEAFANAEPIRGKPMLAVPIPGSPAETISVGRGKRRTEVVEARYGEMRVVVLRTGLMMLVAKGRANNAGGVKALVKRRASDGSFFRPENQKNQVEIPMFWLVPSVRLGNPLPWARVAQEIKADYRGRLERTLRERVRLAQSQAVSDVGLSPAKFGLAIDDMGRPIAGGLN